MPAPRRARTRLACGLAATAVAAVLALAPLAGVTGPLREALAWVAGLGLVLAAAAALRLGSLLGPALVVLLAEYTRRSWSAGATASTPPPPCSGPACSSTPSWPAGPGRPALGSATSARSCVARATVVAASALAALGLGVLVLLAAALPAGGGLARLAIGVVAATATLALVVGGRPPDLDPGPARLTAGA